ncbi:MAG: tagaturonate epimerase family protein [Caldilineaceae bacterium]
MTQSVVSPEVAGRLAQAIGARLYPNSVAQDHAITYCMVNVDAERYLAIFAPEGADVPADFEGESSQVEDGGAWTVVRCPRTPANTAALRERFEWLRPVPLGTQTSFGFGDRIGLATPGHVQSAKGAGVRRSSHSSRCVRTHALAAHRSR